MTLIKRRIKNQNNPNHAKILSRNDFSRSNIYIYYYINSGIISVDNWYFKIRDIKNP